MKYGYVKKDYNKENMARVAGRALPISTKFSVEICNLIRKKSTNEAKKILQDAIDGKKAIPFRIFNKDLSHKRKIGPGRYPQKSSVEIVKLIESVEANAQFKGLNTSNLYITHINAHLASRPWRYGRQRRRKAKRTHIEIVVEEQVKKESEVKKEAPKSQKSKISEGLETKSQSKETLKKEPAKKLLDSKNFQNKTEENKQVKKENKKPATNDKKEVQK